MTFSACDVSYITNPRSQTRRYTGDSAKFHLYLRVLRAYIPRNSHRDLAHTLQRVGVRLVTHGVYGQQRHRDDASGTPPNAVKW